MQHCVQYFLTRRGYTVATFRATLLALFDERLPSSHAIMFTSRNPKWRRNAVAVLALMLLDGEKKGRIKRRNRPRLIKEVNASLA